STDVVDSAASVPFVCRGGFADRGTTPARHCGAQTPLTSGDDLRSLEIILFDFPVEALAVDAEEACGLVLVAAALTERRRYQAPLRVGERRQRAVVEAQRIAALAFGRRHRQIRERDQVGARERKRPLDDVLQLADVPRPRVRAQLLERLRRHALRGDAVLPAEA